ncbi:hypothetical protein THUN1379_24770 [Paludibacterium sp. THUN1379]|nr:hypothetical protein THUN1379_24770 [Paludibacterium sp. THUN1379]
MDEVSLDDAGVDVLIEGNGSVSELFFQALRMVGQQLQACADEMDNTVSDQDIG